MPSNADAGTPLPCPFCGKAPEVEDIGQAGFPQIVALCSGGNACPGGTLWAFLEDWNRRAPVSPSEPAPTELTTEQIADMMGLNHIAEEFAPQGSNIAEQAHFAGRLGARLQEAGFVRLGSRVLPKLLDHFAVFFEEDCVTEDGVDALADYVKELHAKAAPAVPSAAGAAEAQVALGRLAATARHYTKKAELPEVERDVEALTAALYAAPASPAGQEGA